MPQVQSNSGVPILEARPCAVADAGHARGSTDVLPLLKLKEFDQYTTTHA